MDLPALETVALTAEHTKSGFRCGKKPLDEFFAKYARQNAGKGSSKTWVLLRGEADPPEFPAVLGYYALTVGDIERETYPEALARKLPRYAIPVAIIARLAVDGRAQGR